MCDDILIKESDVEKLEKIGSGAMGEIHRAKFRNEDAVVKQSKHHNSKQLREEFEIYFSLQNHDNILKLYGVIAENYHLVLEYAPNGDLSQYLKVNTVDWRSKAKICHGIARGVMHCHKNNVYHLDLKPENILLDKDFTPKLADFGFSNSKSRLELKGGKAGGTMHWLAPERVSSDAKMYEFFEKYPKLSDVYSFGLVLWSVAMDGEIPYKELSFDKIKNKKCDRNTMKRLLKRLPKESPHRYTQLISDLTKYDPEERCQLPSALLELEHVLKYYSNPIEDKDNKLQVINYSSSTISHSSGNANNISHESQYEHHVEDIEEHPYPTIPQYLSMEPFSIIITENHKQEILSWINEVPHRVNKVDNFKLLLRGSRDGYDRETFHKLCDKVPQTLIILKVNNTDEILGGYNPLSWDRNHKSGFLQTKHSFIFSLSKDSSEKSILSRVKKDKKAIINAKDYGPSFGVTDLVLKWNHNLSLKDDDNDNCSCENFSYEKPISVVKEFSIDDYEAFQII